VPALANIHDLRSQYRKDDLPAASRIAVDVIDDPYPSLEIGAQLEQARHADGTVAEGAPGWSPPPRPLVTVIRSLREDPLGRMFARRQIDQPQYLGGREYQSIYDATQIGSLGSVDLTKMKVDGGLHPEPLTEARQRAAKRLRSVDGALLHHHGVEGLSLVRGVLSDRQSVEFGEMQASHGRQSRSATRTPS
jgi:hypothetical protein